MTAWSGDLVSDWETFKRQIPAGLNFELSGLPYWTTDIGGFVSTNPDNPAYRELYIRWFEYGVFCPIFRTHGTRTTNQNELWSYGPEAQKILVSFDRLRYQLMPYIYSLAWKTTNENYTPMRPLVMDFRNDARAQNTGDEFLFGPAILVAPVTEPEAITRRLYLPAGKWYDFWTGQLTEGGKAIEAAAPIERIPLFVRAGSIVPMGPDLEYAIEKPADPIDLRVYKGADGNFTLYEDENDNYDYEKGIHATIQFHWDDAGQSLTYRRSRRQLSGNARQPDIPGGPGGQQPIGQGCTVLRPASRSRRPRHVIKHGRIRRAAKRESGNLPSATGSDGRERLRRSSGRRDRGGMVQATA